MFNVTFWGTRGSIPCPGKDTIVFGGNTTCLEIRAGKKLVIVDLGTGIKPLGDRLIQVDSKREGITADIFVSHTHWDHIMGFPMFGPIFMPNSKLHIRGPVSFDDESLEQIIGGQLAYRYWPITRGELSARIEYTQIGETSTDLGDGLCVTSKFLNHPILCLGYRFEYEGKSIVTAFDHEPFRNLFSTDPADPGFNEFAAQEGETAASEENEKISRFYEGADLLVHDCQYTEAEFEHHLGWGHSSYNYALDTAASAGVKKLILFHHDPNRTDAQLEELEQFCQKKAGCAGNLTAIMAREGQTLEV